MDLRYHLDGCLVSMHNKGSADADYLYRMAGSPAWLPLWRSTLETTPKPEIVCRYRDHDLTENPLFQPQHAPVCFSRQDPDHLEPHPR